MSQSDYRWMRTVGQLSAIGLLIGVSVLIGLGLGCWLDSKLGTAPWLAFTMTLIGLAAGLYESMRLLLKAIREDDDH